MYLNVKYFCQRFDIGSEPEKVFVEGKYDIAGLCRPFGDFVVCSSDPYLVDREFYLETFGF